MLPYGPRGWLVELPEDDVVGYAARRRAPSAIPTSSSSSRRRAPCSCASATSTAPAPIGAWLAAIAPDRVERADPGRRGRDRRDLRRRRPRGRGGGLRPRRRGRRSTGTRGRATTCAFCGFAPGFAYLRGLDPALHLPRRATPRTRVPAGAVAIADTYAAVYPSASPGGWHLLGHTDARLWDAEREPPALDRARHDRPVRRAPAVTELARRARPGWATTVQDGGRPGYAAIGVPAVGCARRAAARSCSTGSSATPRMPPCSRRSVGCEVATSGPAVVATSADLAPRTVGPTRRRRSSSRPPGRCGATSPCAAASTSGPSWARAARRPAPASDRRRRSPAPGCRSVADPATAIVVDVAPRADGTDRPIGVHPGPRAEWFTPDAHGAARRRARGRCRATSAASASASTARRCARSIDGELPSEGMLPGAIQVPPDGRPVVMLADHPTTGGYPVIAVVDPAALPLLAQRRPGADGPVPPPTVSRRGSRPTWG